MKSSLIRNKCILLFFGCCFLLLSLCSSVSAESSDLLKYVDPYIGTGGHGHTFLGASVPFGAIQPGPNNFFQGWDWCSGYHYSEKVLKGFSHTHLSGTGIGDLGDILVMPYTGKITTDKGTKDNPEKGYASHYSHDREIARPSYYSVMLDDYDIKVELTATERVALHSYRFPTGKAGHVIIDLREGNNDNTIETYMERIDEKTFGGYRFSKGWAKDQRVYFAVSVQGDVKDFNLFNGNKKLNGTSGKDKAIKGVLSFNPARRPIMLKVAISPVSIENARANIAAEMPGWNFKKVVSEGHKKWNDQLNKIKIETGSDSDKRVFYTAMYHTMIAPVLFNDNDRQYRGTDKKVYTDVSFDNYSIFSLWDTYRAQHPLLTITQPERVNDMINSMLAIYKQQGTLPVWHLLGNETGTMVGYHSVPVIVDAYMKGFDGFDAELAFEAMKVTAKTDNEGVGLLMERGYIPGDKEVEAVAKALEYAIDDACIAMMAKSLGKQKDYEYFLERSKMYAKYFDKETQFMRGRMADGTWRTPFDPVASTHRKDDFCEGNAWQYTWLVPHDPDGLISLFDSKEAFITKLDSLFTVSSELGEGASADITGLIGQYAHGNEPGHHITYMYAFAGQQWKTAEKVRQILKTMYNDTPAGLTGNEDCGQMSAWYVLSSMGFYPVHPANGKYIFGSPAFDSVEINLPKGKKFTIKAKNNSDNNIYIQSAEYNGKPYSKVYITHKMITEGGTLILEMGSNPNKSFAAGSISKNEVECCTAEIAKNN